VMSVPLLPRTINALFGRGSEPIIAATPGLGTDTVKMAPQTPELANISTAATTRERLILHFHGLGPTPDWINPQERNYWCSEQRFTTILEASRDHGEAAAFVLSALYRTKQR
jgi:hypothetical protein